MENLASLWDVIKIFTFCCGGCLASLFIIWAIKVFIFHSRLDLSYLIREAWQFILYLAASLTFVIFMKRAFGPLSQQVAISIILFLTSLIVIVLPYLNKFSENINKTVRGIKTHVTSENNAIKELIIDQFTVQSKSIIENMNIDRKLLSDLITCVQDLQKQMKKGFDGNTDKFADLKSSLTYSISESGYNYINQLNSSVIKLSSENQGIESGLEQISVKIVSFNDLIERHLKQLEEGDKVLGKSVLSLKDSLSLNASKIYTKVIDSEEELKQSFGLMNGNLAKYLSQLKQFEALYNNLQKLYSKLMFEEEKISKQEGSLVAMVSRHAQIFEIISEMNNTSKEIFEFMKLYLIHSTIDTLKNK